MKYSLKLPCKCRFALYKPCTEFPGIEQGPPQLQTAYLCACVCVRYAVRKHQYRLHISPSFCDVSSFTQDTLEQSDFKTHTYYLYGPHRHTFQHFSALSIKPLQFSSFYDPYTMLLLYTLPLVGVKSRRFFWNILYMPQFS